MRRSAALTLQSGENNVFTGVVDTTNGFAYFGTNTTPGQIIKVQLSDFTRVGVLSGNSGEDSFVGSAIDVANGFAYFSTNEGTSNIVKVQLSDFTRVGAVNVAGGGFVQGLTMDTTNGFLYAATNTIPSNVYKINLSTFTNTANIALAAGENNVVRIVLDPANDTGYFPTQTSPAKIVKVTLSTLTRVGALTLDTGENNVRAAAIDAINGFAYFGTNTTPGIVIKVRLSDFTRVGAVTLSSGENSLYGAAIDTTNSHLYVITRTTPGGMVKLSTSSFTRLGGVTFESGENPTEPAVLDVANGFIYSATQTSPGKIIKVNTNHTSFIHGTKVTLPEAGTLKQINFYSHAASGTIRLALYDSTKTLLWQSGVITNTAAGTIIPVSVEAGTPTALSLAAGTYYFAFQQSSTSSVASYTAGSSGDGWFLAQSFGSFPSSITGESSTSDLYTLYGSYNATTTANAPGAVVPVAPAQTPPPQLIVVPELPITAHALGTNVIDSSGTIYTITQSGNTIERRPYTSAAAFLSYSFNSFDVITDANTADLSLPIGSFVPPRDGVIICSDRSADKGTCYIISEGKKRGVSSAAIFSSLGYSFTNAYHGDVSFLQDGSLVNSASEVHPVGTLINNHGTLQIVGPGYLIGVPDIAIMQSWGYEVREQVSANEEDLKLTQTKVLVLKIASQIGSIY